jgi:c-di-GMP-specific phosphodiesterase
MTSQADRDALYDSIKQALQANAFEPAFQPVTRLSTGAVAGFEALARWRQGPEALAGTSAFIEEALARDLLGEIGRRMLIAACAALRTWDAGDIFMSVNIVGHDLQRDAFVDETLDILSGLPAGTVRLEVTEQQVLHDPPRMARQLARLREAGVKILFDDFGSGFSSFTWLTRLPADALKFDHALISGIAARDAHFKIVRAMIALAHELGLETVAEGVETEAQRNILADLGCDYAQGHLFSEALGPREARVMIGR